MHVVATDDEVIAARELMEAIMMRVVADAWSAAKAVDLLERGLKVSTDDEWATEVETFLRGYREERPVS